MRKSKLRLSSILLGLMVISLSSGKVYAHCEIPCGIYGDSVRISLLYEHIATIEKSMIKINELSTAKNVDYNQMVRWVMNKEQHATEMQDIISQYFLHQRVKPKDSSQVEAYGVYIKQLTLLHKLQVLAMKSKQGTDVGYIKKMQDLVHEFEHAYFGNH